MTPGTVVVRLSALVDGLEAVCYAALVKKTRGMTARNQPFVRCLFRDKRVQYEAMLWHDHPFFAKADSWTDGMPYRLEVRGKHDLRFGMQIELLGIRPATDGDAEDGFDFFDLVESSQYDARELIQSVVDRVKKYIDDAHLRQLVLSLLEEHGPLFSKMPAAQSMHHSYTAGLLEHVWSMSRVAGLL